jgi:hypothetical protein
MFYRDHPKSIFEYSGWSYAKIALYLLLSLIVMICCVANFKRLIKDLFRLIRYSRQSASPGEEGQLRVRNYEDGQSDF